MISRPQETLQACRFDPRFAFALRLPPGGEARCLLVVVHDSTRDLARCFDPFAEFAQAHRCAVLAPLFPAGVLGDGYEDGYKFLSEGDICYDRVLNAMVDEAFDRTACRERRLLMHGYSGGGQFVHRYWLLHPGRLRAVVIGAPGKVTLLDNQQPWWSGVQDTLRRFAVAVDAAALRQVPALLLVGDRDTRTDGLSTQPPSRWWPSQPARLSADRIHRLTALHRSLQHAGVQAQLEMLPGASHGSGRLQAAARACRFFAAHLR